MAIVVAQLSANGPVSVFFYLLLVRKHDGLIEPGELQLHTGSFLQDDMINSSSITCLHDDGRQTDRQTGREREFVPCWDLNQQLRWDSEGPQDREEPAKD